MNPYVDEEVAWQRLQDIQREMENSRLLAAEGLPATWRQIRLLAQRVWWLAGLAARRAPRRRQASLVAADGDEPAAATHAA